MSTPRLTHHARERCAEMGVVTKRVKRILQAPDVDRPCKRLRCATSDADPGLAVIYAPGGDGEPDIVITVVPRVTEEYDRTSMEKTW